MRTLTKSAVAKSALVGSLASLSLAVAVPASAADIAPSHAQTSVAQTLGDFGAEYKKRDYRSRYDDRRYSQRARYYDEPVYRDTRVWEGRDGRYYCRKKDGTTGLLIGAGVGGLIGHELAGRGGDRTLGAILGAAGGAILGRAIDRKGSRCR